MSRSVRAIDKLLESGARLLMRKLMYTDKPRCRKCKAVCEYEESFLYLMPGFVGDEHIEEIDYYVRNGVPIEDTNQIPPGRRACYFNVFHCPKCGYRNVSIVDFLNVRDNTLVKGIEECPYSEVEMFLRKRY